jgi:acetyl-CoA/propionyl-CoA carboxylase carboxyl transferase subunit
MTTDDSQRPEAWTTEDSVEDELARRRREALRGGGEERIEAQHEKGKLTARERIAYVLDEGSFREVGPFVEHQHDEFGLDEQRVAGDAVITGYGEVDGRKVFLYALDFTVLGGSVGEVVADKIAKVTEMAVENGAPVLGIWDSGGARIQEGVDSLAGFARVFQQNVTASGVVPQVSVIMGPCAGGATYAPALTDFTFMVNDTSYMMITGPDVIETVTGEQVTKEELGGAQVHATKSGVAHAAADTEEQALDDVRRLLSYLPPNHLTDPPSVRSGDDPARATPELDEIVPSEPRKPYDVVDVVEELVDQDTFYEVHGMFARNVLTGFARLDGSPVGVVANQPRVNAGTLDIQASQKGARFVRFCDAFNLPIVTLVDVPGFMPGTSQEHNGIIRHGAKLIYAYAEATVPLLTVVTRKAYGGSYIVMGSKYLGADINYAWPDTEMAVMGPRGAVNILYRDELSRADDPERLREELVEEYREEFANPYGPAKRGYIDDVIRPAETRRRLVDDLDVFRRKNEQTVPKDHGNVPL